MAAIVHFDLAADDVERAKDFYSKLFDWKIEKLPSPPGAPEYWLIETKDLKGKPGVGGGMAKREKPDQKIVNFVEVESIDGSLKQVERLGGKIVEPKWAIPGMGYIATCLDTEGNQFGLLEGDKNVK